MSARDPIAAPITLERIGRVAVATLARPPVNAFDDALVDGLDAMVTELAADEGVSVLHLRSDQKAFCAGADLALMQACFATPDGSERMLALVRRMQQLFERLEAAALLTLAEIGGAALGGGLELALACDLRAAASEARLGLPEAGLGLVPAAGGTQRLARACGLGVAKRLILGAETVDGAEALRLGLVHWVQPRAELATWTRALAARLATIPKAAVLANKRCLAAAHDPGRDGFAEELDATRELYAHAETRRRVAEFLARSTRSGPRKEIA